MKRVAKQAGDTRIPQVSKVWTIARHFLKKWDSREDPTAEKLYAVMLSTLGVTRKSSASKIKTVALAAAQYGFDPTDHRSLNAAYTTSRRYMNPMCPCPYCPGHAKQGD